MILGRLFGALFKHGVTVVATSNVEPDRLYEGGLNRALFLPFVAELKARVEVLRLDSRTDFRLEKLGGTSVYHVPADAAAGPRAGPSAGSAAALAPRPAPRPGSARDSPASRTPAPGRARGRCR